MTSKDQRQPSGSIDHTIDLNVKGWFFGGKYPEKSFYLSVDDSVFGPFIATQYRPDLHAVSSELSHTGFSLPIPIEHWDGAEHTVSIVYRKKSIFSRKLVLPESKKKISLLNSIIREQENTPVYGIIKVAIYSTFTNGCNFHAYHHLTINWLRKHGYYVIAVIPVNDLSNVQAIDQLLMAADSVIIRTNVGYDFGSWSSALLRHKNMIEKCDVCLFINDSIIGPLDESSKIIEHFESSKGDFWSATDSFDRQYHSQSFMYGVKKRLLQSPYFNAYFINDFSITAEKTDIIERYELKMLMHFSELGFVIDIFIKYQDLIAAYKININNFLVSLIKLDSIDGLYFLNGEIHTFQVVNYIRNVISQIESGTPLNPTHFFWLELIQQGFPFIKKELLTSNPVDNKLITHGLSSLSSDSVKLISSTLQSVNAGKVYS